MTTVETQSGAGRREWIGLALLGLPTFLVAMDFSVLYLGVPQLTADLAPSGVQQLWIVDIYGFVIAGFLVTMGTIGDRIGRRRLLLGGAAVFGLASVMAAFAQNPETLIAARALLGVSGAAVMPSVLALITTMFTDAKQRGKAISVYLACFMGGSTLGPLVGGVLLEFFWWGSVFLISVPGIVLLLVFGPALLPDQRSGQAGRLDPLSVVLSLAAILPFVYGIKELVRNGWHPGPAIALLAGIAIAVVFVRRQRTLDDPMLELALFGNKTFRYALILFFVAAAVGAGILLLVAIHLQNVTGLTPLNAGLLLLVPNILMIIGNLTTPQLANKIRPAYLIAGGLIVAAGGYLMFTLTGSTSGPSTLFFALCIVMIGTAPLAALCNHLAMGEVPPEKAGSGAAIVQTTTEFALALGIATLATIAGAIYRTTLNPTLTTLPPHAADAARESVDRAIATAPTLPTPQADHLITTARDAFTTGLHTVAIICAILFTALAALTIHSFKHVKNMQPTTPQPTETTDTDTDTPQTTPAT